ncbi:MULTISPECIES: fimbrial biogenesis chaperone [Enterobacter]|uniref:Molecular chaperone n=1 Tax=Enterobacter vonholyi TaxID=2797505 RepID=A0ABU6E910_9ENTR|nr:MULTISPECIES: molecular chaperone [Enterobacter]MCK6997457.1 molecular chaperone [Enterobacter asburiae]MCM7569026.1 molecular chaperone [Enterobacter asburiae]MEB6412272.1 molecular chaperone [Enterobacter vonholyi]
MKIRPIILFFAAFGMMAGANANVVMTGTRVIVPFNNKEKTVQLKNPDSQPYVVQMQITDDKGKPDSHSPFIIVPPVFRMERETGQSVRLITKDTSRLPQNRESIFYLSFTQLPMVTPEQKSQNQLVLAITNRVKIFYRPAGLGGEAEDAYDKMEFSASGSELRVKNPTGYFINVRSAELKSGSRYITLAKGIMLDPDSQVKWSLPDGIHSLRGTTIKLIMVNDYGADVIKERHL